MRADLHALLVGVDLYAPNRLPGNGCYESLSGCVGDVAAMAAYLEGLGVPAERVRRLTASNTGAGEPPEPAGDRPTYANLVAAFRRLREVARPGDAVLVHYAGHGGRTRTAFPELKASGWDECLVPADFGATGLYLRDVELSCLVRELVERELRVALVLDCCHSGGALRGRGPARPRSAPMPDTARRPLGRLVAPREELMAAWRERVGPARRAMKLGSGWLPDPRGYVLLAACRPHEKAFEHVFDGEHTRGALTYFLLEALERLGTDRPCQVLHERVVARVRDHLEHQTPMLEGEAGRTLLGEAVAPPPPSIRVARVDEARGRVLLAAGRAHHVRPGARFTLLPGGVEVEVVDAGATESWARILARTRATPAGVEEGCRALPAAGEASRRRAHLARYREVRELAAHGSPLAGSVVAELARLAPDYDPLDRPVPLAPLGGNGSPPVVAPGDWLCLRVRNASSRVLNIAVLDLQPGWSIEQVFPGPGGGAFQPLDPGGEELIPLRADLPPDHARGRDVLKIFATVAATDFRWLELPPLARAGEAAGARRSMRAPEISAAAWTVVDLEVEVARRPGEGPVTQ